MSDVMLRALAENGGVIRINAVIKYIDPIEREHRPISVFMDHIDHAIEVAGADHVGIGLDYGYTAPAPVDLEDISVDETEVDARRKVRYVEVVVGPHFARPLAGIPAKGIPLKRVRRAQDQIEPAAIGGPPRTAGAHVVRDEGIALQIFRSLALGSKPACASHRGRIG